MATCGRCGGAVIFRYVDGVCIPIHLSGGCGSGHSYSRSRMSSCAESPLYAYEHFVNPHARCPVCGADVFYFQASNGGRVYFDELGPPWSKHPCTNNPQIPPVSGCKTTKSVSLKPASPPICKASLDLIASQYRWQENGWEPLLVFKVEYVHNESFIEIDGFFQNQRIKLFFRKDHEFSRHSPMLLKTDAANSRYVIATLSVRVFGQRLLASEKEYFAYPTLQLAHIQRCSNKSVHNAASKAPNRQAEKPIQTSKTISSQQLSNGQQRPREETKRSSMNKSERQTSEPTAMSLAFMRATRKDKSK